MVPITVRPGSNRGGAPRFARSGQMVECLRNALIYSEKRPRDLLFTAIEELLAERSPIMVTQLTRDAAARARAMSSQAGLTFDSWDAASKAVMRTLLMAGGLLGAGRVPIPFDVKAQASHAVALREGFRDRAESFLLEFVIARLGDVTSRDHTALAHALFRQFDPQISRDTLEDRVVILLAGLSGRVTLSGADQTYAVCVAEQT